MKVLKRILKTLLVFAIIAGLGVLGLGWYQQREKTVAASSKTVAYVPVTVSTGSLTKSVTGTGSIRIKETADVTVPFAVTVDEMLVQSGERVEVGTPVARVDMTALKETIHAINEEIATLDSSIASLATAYTGEATVKTSASGRIKQLFAKSGDMTSAIMEEYGGLAVLSGDGKMRVTIPAQGLVLDQTVSVKEGSYTYTGKVDKVENELAEITFSDTRTLPGAEVAVALNGVTIATGKAEINMPFTVSTTMDGYVSRVRKEVNAQVSRNAVLFDVTHIPADTEYDTLIRQREEKLAALSTAREVLVSGAVCADVSGIVNTTAEAGTVVEAGSSLINAYAGDAMQMTISVDELDIIHVTKGQQVSLAMDAVSEKTYTATVSYISQIGSSASGVTNYSVVLDVDGDSLLKIGMNGTATIVVDQVENAVLVPLTAINTGRNGSYVWRYTETPEAEMPGEQVYITTGLSDADYAQVTSGLNAGDVVLITRTSAVSDQKNGSSFSDLSFPMGEGMMQFAPENNNRTTPQRNTQRNTNQNRTPNGNR